MVDTLGSVEAGPSAAAGDSANIRVSESGETIIGGGLASTGGALSSSGSV